MGCDYILSPQGELQHYGVKGMKWGKRKIRDSSKNYDSKKKNVGLANQRV